MVYADPSGHFFWFFAAIFKAIIDFAIAQPIIFGAISGGLMGGVNAAVGGHNIFQGIALGALGGAIGGAIASGVSGFLEAGIGEFWAGAVGVGLGSSSANAATTAISGGDVGMAALGGLASGTVSYFGGYVWPLGADAVAGGVSSEIQGGKFGEGAKYGAIDNAVSTAVLLAMPMPTVGEQNPQGGDTVYMKPDSPAGFLISFFEGGPFSHTGIMTDDQNMAHTSIRGGGEVVNIENQGYTGRQGRVSKRFRGNQKVIKSATALTTQYNGHSRYGFAPGQKVCSTLNAAAYNQAGHRGWYGIGPNSQFRTTKTYGE